MCRAVLLAVCVALVAPMAHAQWYDFYPNASGDASSWTDPDNWVRYKHYDTNLYPPDFSPNVYGGTYPNKPPDVSPVAYIRDEASVTIASGESIGMGEVQVGGIYYYDATHPVLPRTQSTLTVGGTLTCAQYLFVGGVYQGVVVLKPGARITTAEFRVAFPDETVAWAPASTFRVEGGYFSGHRSEVGNDGMTGWVVQTGGTAKYNWLNLGYGDSGGAGTGIYDLYDGLLSPTEFALGNASWLSTGHLNLMGGTVSFEGTSPPAHGFFGVYRGSVKLGKGFRCDVTGTYDDCRYQQESQGSLIVELKNDSEFGYMSVAAAVTLNGTFEAVVAPGADWDIGDTFEVLRSRNGNISATQAFLDSYNLIGDRYFDISIDDDGLLLTAIRAPSGTIPQPHPGDANNNGLVDVGDLGILAFNWGNTSAGWAQANFTTPDTEVNVGDLGVLAFNWGWVGAPAGAGNVPEPASLALLGLGGLAMLRRRR